MTPVLVLLEVVQVAMLAGLLLIVFVPFFPGLAIITGALAVYVGYAYYLTQTLGAFHPLELGLIAVATVLGLSTSWWTEKLGFRFQYVSREVMICAFLGMCIAAVLRLPMDFQILFMFLGAMLGEVYIRKNAVKEGLRGAPIAIYSLLGPRGFQLLMALLCIYWASPGLRMGLPVLEPMRMPTHAPADPAPL